jgi:hypothetical protein
MANTKYYTLQEILNLAFDETSNGLKIAGTVSGDLTITGDLTVTGDFEFGAAVASSLIVDGTGTEIFLVRKDVDAGDVLAVNTTSAQVLITADTNDGTTKILRVLDSDAAEVFSVNSDGDISANSISLGGDGTFGDIEILKQTDDTVGAILNFYKDSASPAANDDIMQMTFSSNDDLGAKRTYGKFLSEVKDPANADLDGRLTFYITGGGTEWEAYNIQGLATGPQTQYSGLVSYSGSLQMADNVGFILGASGANQASFDMDTSQTNKMLRLGLDQTSGTFLIDKGSTTNDHEIPVSTNYATLALASGITWDPDVSNNVYSTMHYDENLILSGAPQFGTTGTVPAVHNNGVVVAPQTATVGGTSDFAFSVTRTLNDPNAAGGSDYFSLIDTNLTITDATGWDDVMLLTLRTGGVKKFIVDSDGKVGIGTSTPAGLLSVSDITAPTIDMIVNNLGASGTPCATSGVRGLFNTAYYGGNVVGTTQLNDTYSTGLTTQGNLMASYSATIHGHASDAAGTFMGGFIADYYDGGGSEAAAAFISLHTVNDWDIDFASVAGDNKISAVAVAPGDGWDVYLTGGNAITGGSAQAGGDVILGGGTQSGGGENGFVKIVSGLIVPTEAVTANVDTDSEAMYFGCDTVGADTIEIQTEDIIDGRVFIIKDEGGNASAQTITISTEGAETIDGQPSATITGDYDSLTLIARNGNLFII